MSDPDHFGAEFDRLFHGLVGLGNEFWEGDLI